MKAVFSTTLLLLALTSAAYERYPAVIESLSVNNGLASIRVFKYTVDSAPFIDVSEDLRSGLWSVPEQYAYTDGFYWVIVTPATSGMAFYRAWRKARIYGLGIPILCLDWG